MIGGDARADEICQLLTNEADTDLRRSVLLGRASRGLHSVECTDAAAVDAVGGRRRLR